MSNNDNGPNQELKIAPKASALIPFLVFVAVYLGAALILQAQGVEMAFYQFDAPIALVIAIAVGFAMFPGTIDEKFSQFARGAGDEDIILMCTIYLLSGAFGEVAKNIGAVDSTANLGLSLIPPQFVTAGLFLIASFLSIATGTSMGTIAVVSPIAVQVANTAQLDMALVLGAVIGGSLFGDNLSIISDTAIAATKSQGCELRDKFKINFTIALPAAILTFILLLLFAQPETIVPLGELSYNLIEIVPYVLVFGLALAGVNVFLTLMIGIVVAFVIGIFGGSITFLQGVNASYAGFLSMIDIFLLSMFMGGLATMVTENGGIEWIMSKISKFVKGQKSAEVGIAAVVAVADLAIANNTVAIIVSGPICRSICDEYHVDPRRSSSIMDISSCVFQGLIPYGAQIILACSLAGGVVSPFAVVPNVWYAYALAVFAVVSMFVPFADGVIRKEPWNWETRRSEPKKG